MTDDGQTMTAFEPPEITPELRRMMRDYYPLDRWPAGEPMPLLNPVGRTIPRVGLDVVMYCAEEVRRQRDTPWHVYRMVSAWAWSLDWHKYSFDKIGKAPITHQVVRKLGAMIDEANADGYRTGRVRVGGYEKLGSAAIHGVLTQLIDVQLELDPAEWYRQFEEIHPFMDGNGRTGKILYNWLNNTLNSPVYPPSFWGDITNP